MTIKTGFWNINGLGEEKINNPEFKNITTQYDIGLTETWDREKMNLILKINFLVTVVSEGRGKINTKKQGEIRGESWYYIKMN